MNTDSFALSRRGFVKGAGMAAAAALFADLGLDLAGGSLAQAADGTTFTYAIAGDPGSNVNPVTTNDRFGLMTLKLLYSPLFAVRAEGIKYFLAESYDVSDDKLTLTVHLRQDVKWSDGEPFTADDVVFTYETIESVETADAYASLNYGDEGKVEVAKVDDSTVTFTFPAIDAAAAETLQGPDGVYIFPKHAYEGVTDWENNDVNANPVGTGPYTIAAYQPGSYVQFVANPDYFKGTPQVDNVVYQIIENENTGMQAIQTGEVDAWIGTAAQVEQMDIEGNGLTVTAYSEGRVAYIVFNVNRVPDENVRKALFYALDKKTISDAAVLSSDFYDLEYTFLPTNSEFYNPDAVEKYDRDVEKAKQLLADAGNPNPTFTLAYSGSDSLQTNASLIIQEQAAEAGITIELSGMDSTALSNEQKDPDSKFDITFGGYIMGVDPTSYKQLFVSGSSGNYAHISNPEVDDLFDQGRIETDNDKRHEIFDQLQAAIQDQATHYQLYSNKRLLVTGKRVSGFEDAQLIPIYTFEEIDKLKISD